MNLRAVCACVDLTSKYGPDLLLFKALLYDDMTLISTWSPVKVPPAWIVTFAFISHATNLAISKYAWVPFLLTFSALKVLTAYWLSTFKVLLNPSLLAVVVLCASLLILRLYSLSQPCWEGVLLVSNW